MLDSDTDSQKEKPTIEVIEEKFEPVVEAEAKQEESSETVDVAPEQSRAFNGFDYQASDAGESKAVGGTQSDNNINTTPVFEQSDKKQLLEKSTKQEEERDKISEKNKNNFEDLKAISQ